MMFHSLFSAGTLRPALNRFWRLHACVVVLFAAAAHAQLTATMTIQAGQPGASVSSNLFGIFFEEINYAGEGGLYAEMVRNRSFDSSASPDFWALATSGSAAGTISVDTAQPLNTNNLASLKIAMTSGSGSVGAANSGFWGMALSSGATYDLNFYARGASGVSGPLLVRLQDSSGSTTYAQTSFGGLTTNWQRFSASLISSATDTNAKLVLSISNVGTIWLDTVSLFPRATFAGRTNGLRPDLANMLNAMKPSFLRYPGGNFIESQNVTNAVRWKKTIGDLAARPGHLNDSWGYWSTDGYGLDEAFRQCEDMNMEMLYDINAGLMLGYNGSANNTVPLAEMGPWVQDAVDLIAYANDATNTFWGAQRAANGHPAPYNLKYLEIGNENGGTYLNDRYTLFYDAIKSNYPAVHLIAAGGNWGGGPPTSRPVEIQDEHYYSDPATMASYATLYDSRSRNGSKVFVGEYAVWSSFGVYGNLTSALAEAAFMTGMERNSDIVLLASYAPLFANVNGTQWKPDMIYYDNTRSFGTPSYYVQKMFGVNRGDVVLPASVVGPANFTNPPPRGAVGLGSWNTTVQYTNIVVTSNGVTLYQSDFVNQGTNGWRVLNGTWSAASGIYQQTALITDCRSTTGSTNWANYTLSLRARKTSGSEGFLILFDWLDDNNWTWLNLGGWGNTLHGIEQNVNGNKSILGTRTAGSIVANQWYDISIVLTGARMQCYLNGTLIQDVTSATTLPASLFASTTYDQRDQQIIVKAVNTYPQPLATAFNLAGIAAVASNATVVQLTSANLTDENSFSTPTKVSPVTNTISNAGTNFVLTLPANSLSVLRLQLPSPLAPTGLRAVVNGWQIALSWAAYDTAANFILKRATNIAGPYTVRVITNGTAFVDASAPIGGTVYYTLSALLLSGQTPDTLPVSATVGASLQAYLPFDNASGTTATDVTGHGWNGTLINGPTWVSGYSNSAVNLSGSSQYISLPVGVVSNLNDFSITAWVNVNSLATWSRIFDFGNGTTDFMFLTPLSSAGTLRFAMTTNGVEQQINAPMSLPTGGWHHIAVTLTGGVGVLYLDGAPVGTNNAITLTPASLGVTTQNWIGRSQFSPDPYLTGAVDDFRIYRGSLAAGEVATLLTPLATPTGLAGTPGDARVSLAWNTSANASGYTIAASTNSGGPFFVKASNVVGLAFTDTNVLNGVLHYYVVSATNSVGSSGNSTPVSVRPVASSPPNLSVAWTGGQLQFNWPPDHTGWRLQSQTNSSATGLGTNWFDVPGSNLSNSATLPMNTTQGTGFYRLVYP